MDPVEICSAAEVDSFLSEFGSRNNFRRNSKDSKRHIENNNNERGSFLRSLKSQEFTKIVLTNEGNVKQQEVQEDEEDELSLEDKDSEEESSRAHRFTGLLLAVLACVAFSLASLIVKYLKDYHPFTKSVWRFQGIILPSIPMMVYSRCLRKEPIFDPVIPPCKDGNWKNTLYLTLRALVGFATIILQFYSLQYISLADQMVLGSSQPVFVAIVAYFMLGEKFGIVPFVTSIITILGVCIVAKPPFLTGAASYDDSLLIGSALAMGSMLMSTMSIIFMRRLKDVHVSIITFTFGFYSGVLSLIGALSMGVFQFPKGENHILLALLLAALVFVSQFCTTMALKYEQAGPVSLTRTSNIVFAFLWQYIFLSEVPDMFSILGACIITFGVALTGVRKWVSTLPEKNKGRQFCRFLLL